MPAGCLVLLPKAQLWLLSASQYPHAMSIGRPPFLSKAINQQARRGEIDFGSKYVVQILLATRARVAEFT